MKLSKSNYLDYGFNKLARVDFFSINLFLILFFNIKLNKN